MAVAQAKLPRYDSYRLGPRMRLPRVEPEPRPCLLSSPTMNRTLEDVKGDLKRLLVENLCLEEVQPDDITDDMNLFGEEGLGLDSLDGVEIVVILQRQYGLDVKDMQAGRDIFRCINTLADYVLANATEQPSP